MAKVDDKSLNTFQEWKIGKLDYGYLVFNLVKGSIVITKTGVPGASWADVCKEFQPDAACWITYHFGYTTKEGGKRTKTTLIRWVPDLAKPKDKMEYATWSVGLRNSLSGIHCSIQSTDVSELDYEVILEKVAKFERDEI